MKGHKPILVVSVILSAIWFTSVAYAGFRIRLEKDVPRRRIEGEPTEVKFKLFESEIASTPITSQTFPSGSWSARYVFKTRFRPFPDKPRKGMGMVRFIADFTNTDSLTNDMGLWVEIELDGVVKGAREKINQETWALFAEEAFFADEAAHAIDADNATNADNAATADDVYDRDINPRSVTITGYGPVIDNSGQWVGDPTNLQGSQGPEGPQGPKG